MHHFMPYYMKIGTPKQLKSCEYVAKLRVRDLG